MEGRGFNNPLGPVKLSLKILPHLLPEGEEDGAYITVGQHQGEPFTVKVWREEERVMGSLENAKSCTLGEIGAFKENEGEIMLTGFSQVFLSFVITLVSEMSLATKDFDYHNEVCMQVCVCETIVQFCSNR